MGPLSLVCHSFATFRPSEHPHFCKVAKNMYYPVTYFMPAYNTKQWRLELTDSSNAVRIISTMVKTSYTRILRKLAIALT